MSILIKPIVLFCINLLFYCGLCYGVDERIGQPNQGNIQQQTISAPSGNPASGSQPSPATPPSSQPGFAPAPTIDANMGMGGASIPIINNVTGKIIDINKGAEKWIVVRDEMFMKDVKIKINNLESTSMIKDGQKLNFEDINIGDISDVVYLSDANSAFTIEGDENNIVSSLQVLTKDDMEMRGIGEDGLIMVSNGSAENTNNTAKNVSAPAIQPQQKSAVAVEQPVPKAIIKPKPQPVAVQSSNPKKQEQTKKQGFFDKFMEGIKKK